MLPEAVPIQPAVVPQDSGQLLLASADRGGQVVVSQKAIAPQVRRHIVKPSEDHELPCKLALAKLNDDLVLAASVIEPDDQSHTEVTKGSVSYLSSPCFSTSLGGIGGPAHGIHGILAVMYWISIIRAPPSPENGHGFNSHG